MTCSRVEGWGWGEVRQTFPILPFFSNSFILKYSVCQYATF